MSDVIGEIVARRGAALRDGDAARWRATVTDITSAIGVREVEAFASLQALGVTSLDLVAVVSVDSSGWPGSAQAVIDLGYAVPGVDRALRVARRTVVVAPGARGDLKMSMSWRSPTDPLEVFDIGPIEVSHSEAGVLAIADPASAPTAKAGDVAWAARLSAARERTSEVMGDVPPVLVVVPQTLDDFAGLVKRGSTVGAERISAVTEGARPSGVAAPADRVILNTGALATLSEEGQTVVLAHELTHVTLRVVPPRPVPLWWIEGCAEWTAYQGVILPESLRWKVAIDRHRSIPSWPTSLPGEADFASGSSEFATSYVISEIAVGLLARHYGARVCTVLATAGDDHQNGPTAELSLGQFGTSDPALSGEVHALLSRMAGGP
ncbi:MAG TPA: hypothetical protein PLL54_02970 [Dermatophilaceae bacterium]|nr:hypothetical protein [Dermatophilaceae bacterium]